LSRVETAARALSGDSRLRSYRYIAVRIAAGTAAKRVRVMGFLRGCRVDGRIAPKP
jgi:hypothetical protein